MVVAVFSSKATKLGEAARKAHTARATVFTPYLGDDPGVWADAISAIESAGWRLEHWAVGTRNFNAGVATNNKSSAYPLFRRASR